MVGQSLNPHSSNTTAKYLPPKSKKKFVEDSFRRKVEELERIMRAALRGESLEGTWWPRDLQQLAEWEDPDSGIYKWKSKRIASPGGPHPELYKRFIDAKSKLQSLAERHSSKKLADENRALKGRVKSLAAQNAKLEHALRNVIDALERAAVSSETAEEQLRILYRSK